MVPNQAPTRRLFRPERHNIVRRRLKDTPDFSRETFQRVPLLRGVAVSVVCALDAGDNVPLELNLPMSANGY